MIITIFRHNIENQTAKLLEISQGNRIKTVYPSVKLYGVKPNFYLIFKQNNHSSTIEPHVLRPNYLIFFFLRMVCW